MAANGAAAHAVPSLFENNDRRRVVLEAGFYLDLEELLELLCKLQHLPGFVTFKVEPATSQRSIPWPHRRPIEIALFARFDVELAYREFLVEHLEEIDTFSDYDILPENEAQVQSSSADSSMTESVGPDA